MRRARGYIVFVALFLMAMLVVAGLRAPMASAQVTDSCPADVTIASLQTCVQNAAEIGHIDNQGVTRSLLAKLDAAQVAVNRGQPQVAVQMIQTFEIEVRVEAGQHMDMEHAQHMLMRAEMVIEALGPSESPTV